MTSLESYPGGQYISRLNDLDCQGKRVFVRVDFNVPIRNGVIQDDTRIQAAIPTINALREKGARLVLASHLGRPKGQAKLEYTLEPVAARLGELMGIDTIFAHEITGLAVGQKTKEIRDGEVMVLENLRFLKGEEKNSADLAAKLVKLAECYVNDAFGTCHRSHCSVDALARLFPQRAAGLLLEKEIASLATIVHKPSRPMAAVIGGAKISDKIGVIEALVQKCSKIFVGGAMAYTFLRALDVKTGDSMIEVDKISLCKRLLERATQAKCKILLPIDHLLADDFADSKPPQTSENAHIPDGKMALDIGPKTLELYTRELEGMQSVFWNGPMGVFEKEAYAQGTFGIAKAIAGLDAPNKICGGGDSVSALRKSGLSDQFTHVSTGGGASLEMIEGKAMPGIEALKKHKG